MKLAGTRLGIWIGAGLGLTVACASDSPPHGDDWPPRRASSLGASSRTAPIDASEARARWHDSLSKLPTHLAALFSSHSSADVLAESRAGIRLAEWAVVRRDGPALLDLRPAGPLRVQVTPSQSSGTFRRHGRNAAALSAFAGNDWIVRARAGAVEDYVILQRRPPRAELTYRLVLSAGTWLHADAGVRFAHPMTPVGLRVAPPFVIDQNGRKAPVAVRAIDCPTQPSDRERTCHLELSWRDEGLEYPAVLDPLWRTASNSAFHARSSHTATPLGGGRVLLAGGLTGNVPISNAEVFDLAGESFTALPNLSTPRYNHAAVGLGSGKALLVGGRASVAVGLDSSALYDEAQSPAWVAGAVPKMNVARPAPTATLLKDGRVLVVGQNSAEVLDLSAPGGPAWKSVTGSGLPQTGHQSARLLDGRVLIAGGTPGLTTTFLFDPTSDTITPGPVMSTPRLWPSLTTLGDGRVLVSGGTTNLTVLPTQSAEIFDPKAPTAWQPTGSLVAARARHVAALLPNGNVLLAGGFACATSTCTYLNSAELYSPKSGGFAATQPLQTCRAYSAGASILSGAAFSVLVSGGLQASNAVCQTKSTAWVPELSGAESTAMFRTKSWLTLPTNALGGGIGTGGFGGVGIGGGGGGGGIIQTGGGGGIGGGGGGGTGGGGTTVTSLKSVELFQALPLGEVCKLDGECVSGHCVDGVCCDAACSGACQACVQSKTGAASGTCAAVTDGTDPDSDCTASGQNQCGNTGACKAGSCELKGASEVCGVSCVDPNTLGVSYCDGLGKCVLTLVDCAANGNACNSAACGQSCQQDVDCATSAYCAQNACVPKQALGAACKEDRECGSGHCADGVCCNAACSGQCEACDESGACIAVTGAPVSPRPACSAGTSGKPCAASQCDGSDRKSCAGYAGPSVSCRASQCINGEETLAASCDGTGACPAAQTRACLPFVCDGDACATTCSGDEGCAKGFRCKAGSCVPQASCADDDTVLSPTGETVACAPYRCSDGACRTRCDEVSHCSAGLACSETNACVSPTRATENDSGCGCRLGAGSDTSSWWLVLLSSLLTLGRRRRTRVA